MYSLFWVFEFIIMIYSLIYSSLFFVGLSTQDPNCVLNLCLNLINLRRFIPPLAPHNLSSSLINPEVGHVSHARTFIPFLRAFSKLKIFHSAPFNIKLAPFNNKLETFHTIWLALPLIISRNSPLISL